MSFVYVPGQLEAEALRLDILPITTYDREQYFRWHPDRNSRPWPLSPPWKPCRQRTAARIKRSRAPKAGPGFPYPSR